MAESDSATAPHTAIVSATEPVTYERAGDAAPTGVDLFEDPSAESDSSEYESLHAHREAICQCQKCPLGATRNKFVYGVGNPDADILFIGEAPGADEDRLGEPFVGRAGKLLDKILAAIGFTRDDVYIANILKCRPPGNRDPQPEEMEQCFPYLREQIALIKPKLICALGRVAAQALLETTTPLGKLRGKWHDYHGVPLLVTYHPAALLRFQQYKRGTWEDMQALRAEYDKLTS
jgi:DNA polymerase